MGIRYSVLWPYLTIFWENYHFRWNWATSSQLCTCRTSQQHRPVCRHPLFLSDRKALASVWWWLSKATQRVVVKPLCFVGKHGASPCNSATCEIRFIEHQWGLGLVFITSCRFSQVAPNQMKSFPPFDVLLLFLFEPCTRCIRHNGWFLHLPHESATGFLWMYL